ncbi:hypothetical protein KAI87_14155, partial [Myxococcota bacterium]|nr:hypothetical protein [Myxococcota bacterium]
QVNKGSCKTALTHFEKAIKTNKSSPKITNGRISPSSGKPFRAPNDFELPHAKSQRFEYAGHQHLDVTRESLVDLTYCYSRERKPNRAVSYLRKLAANRDNYVAALRKLANRYAMIGEPNGLASVSRELLALAADASDRLDDARMLHTAINRMRDYSRVGKDLDLIILAMRRQLVSPKRSTDSELKLRSEFELLVRDLATKSHRMLQGQLKASKWSKEPAKASQTIKAYKLYLRTFPQAEASLEILQNLAELLMVNNKALLAGDRFREVALLASARIEKLKAPAKPVAEDDEKEKSAEELLKEAAEKIDGKKKPKKKKKKVIPIKVQIKALKKQEQEALYNAVAAYQKVIAKEKEVGFRERTTARAGLRAAGGAYLELGKIPKDKTRKIKFAIAQSYYDAGDYSRAIDLLSAVVYEYPGTREGSASVHIILDSHNTMQDMSGLIATSKRFLNKHSPLSAKLKKGIKPILDQAEQRRIDDLSLAASGDEEAGLEALLVFAEQNKNTSLGEKALLSAFIAARARGDTT